jgi:DNA-binding response OmpR family regulator
VGQRILIVEDDRATRQGLEELLRGAGYEPTGAATLQEAARALDRDPPDLLIVDVRLGDYNGLQLLITRKAAPVPAIVVSAFQDPVLEADARSYGADFVLKPIDPHDLMRLIAEKLATKPV